MLPAPRRSPSQGASQKRFGLRGTAAAAPVLRVDNPSTEVALGSVRPLLPSSPGRLLLSTLPKHRVPAAGLPLLRLRLAGVQPLLERFAAEVAEPTAAAARAVAVVASSSVVVLATAAGATAAAVALATVVALPSAAVA